MTWSLTSDSISEVRQCTRDVDPLLTWNRNRTLFGIQVGIAAVKSPSAFESTIAEFHEESSLTCDVVTCCEPLQRGVLQTHEVAYLDESVVWTYRESRQL